jgi:hypothetical protein
VANEPESSVERLRKIEKPRPPQALQRSHGVGYEFLLVHIGLAGFTSRSGEGAESRRAFLLKVRPIGLGARRRSESSSHQ